MAMRLSAARPTARASSLVGWCPPRASPPRRPSSSSTSSHRSTSAPRQGARGSDARPGMSPITAVFGFAAGTFAYLRSFSLLRTENKQQDGEDKKTKSKEEQDEEETSLWGKAPAWFEEVNQALHTTWSDFSSRYSQLSAELSKDPGSLYRTVVDKDRHDPEANPEIEWRAKVRLGTELPHAEKAFLKERKKKVRTAFAKLIGVDESEIDERDVPVVAIAGSGGGYRAMTSTTGSLRGARDTGILDVTSYVSGISGSCWALAIWMGLAGGDLDKMEKHIKDRIQTAFLDFDNFNLFINEPTNRYLLSGPINKAVSKNGTTSLVDIYGTLVASRLFVPSDLSQLSSKHLKLSSQRSRVDAGDFPLPIYCAIRHNVPEMSRVAELEKKRAEMAVERDPKQEEQKRAKEAKEEELKKERDDILKRQSYQWFETTPFEFGSEDVGAWIPTWSLGRLFENGRDVEPQPELSMTILSGIFASAFTATLSHYYKEVKPALVALPFFKAVDGYVSSFNEDLSLLHPFPPAELPNPLKGLAADLRPEAPEGIADSDTLGLMDAGAELNIPYQPLFRRGADVIIALDASADSQDLWFKKAATYAQKAGLKSWPHVNYHGPFPQTPEAPGGDEHDSNIGKADGDSAGDSVAKARVTDAKEQADDEGKRGGGQATKSDDVNPHPTDATNSAAEADKQGEPELGKCNIWIGDSKTPDESARMDEPDEEKIVERDGPALVYIPLVPGEGLENPAEKWSTWKFDYAPDETEQLMKLSENNFKAGEEQMVKVLRAMWKRKRKLRMDGERTASIGEDKV